MTRKRSIYKVLFLTLLYFGSIQAHFSQNLINDKKTQEILTDIEYNIEHNNFNTALAQIEKLETNSSFIEIGNNKLEVDLKKAKTYFGRKEQNKAMDILLNNLNGSD